LIKLISFDVAENVDAERSVIGAAVLLRLKNRS